MKQAVAAWFWLLPLAFLAGCRPSPARPATSARAAPVDLLQGDWLTRWERCAMLEPGETKIEPGLLTLGKGAPMTCLRLRDGTAEKLLPATHYRLTWQARRMTGRDFFCGLTFPVNEKRECLSLIVGGWGGKRVGVSSLDDQDASQNETGSDQTFTDGTWYRFVMEVRPERLRVWLDDRVVINVSLRDRRIGLKPGEIEACAPFGIATYATTGEIRDLQWEPLP